MNVIGSLLAVILSLVAIFVIFVCVRYYAHMVFKIAKRKYRNRGNLIVRSPRAKQASVRDLKFWKVHYKRLTGDRAGIIMWYECPTCHNRPLHSRYGDYEELSPYCPYCGEPLGYADAGDE